MISWPKKINSNFIFLISILLPISYYFISPASRSLYLNTETTIETNLSQKIIIFVSALIVSTSFSFLIYPVITSTYMGSRFIKYQRLIPLFCFLGFSVLPLFLAEIGFPKLVQLICSLFRVSYLTPPFADLRSIIIGIGCKEVKAIGDLIVCDTRNSAFVAWNYPSILLQLRILYPLLSNFLIIFIITCLIIILLVYKLIRNQDNSQNILLSIFLISPPFLLCINRMNFDLFIALCTWFAAHLLMNKNSKNRIFAIALLVFSGILKFYGFSSLIFLFLTQRGKFKLYSFFALLLGFLLILPDITSLKNAVGKDIYGSIGLSVLASLLNGKSTAVFQPLSQGFLLVIFIISISCGYLIKSKLVNSLKFKPDLVTSVMGFVFLFTWLSASNYYYRLILTFPILLAIVKTASNDFEKIVIGSTVSALFLSPKIFGPLQNVLLLPLVCYLISLFFLQFLDIWHRVYLKVKTNKIAKLFLIG